MKKHFLSRTVTLVIVPVLALAALLVTFLLLSRSTVNATPDREGAIPKVQAQVTTFVVSGTVTSATDGSPIAGVDVFAWSRDKGSESDAESTTTLADGTYSLTLEAGGYDIIFNPPCGSGFASQSQKGIVGPPNAILPASLEKGFAISGTVYATGTLLPVPDTAIYAFNHDTADGFGLPPADSTGHYCIGLEGGHYDLGFTPPPCLGLGPKTKEVTITQDRILSVTLPLGFTVGGRVTDGPGDPAPGVQIYARECYTWRGYGFSPSNADGYYTGTLPLGTFGIQFLPPADLGLGPKTVTDVVSAAAGCPDTSLDVALPEGLTISGRVTCRGEPVKNVRVSADPVGPPPDCYGLDEVGTYTVDDGSYKLPVVSGTYNIRFEPPPATGLGAVVIPNEEIITNTSLSLNLCPVLKSVDSIVTVPGVQRTYQIVLSPERDIAMARLTDTLSSAVSWADALVATNGNASYRDGVLGWSGPLMAGMPVTITYAVTVTHAPCYGRAAYTDIYTDVSNHALLDDGQGNTFTSTVAAFAIPFGTGSDRTFDIDFGDADNDGDPDLALGNHAPNQVCWNNGDGTFDCENAFGGSPTFDVDWGDMDGDGYLDLVVANSQGHSNLVCLNNRDRTFTCTSFSTCSGYGYASCDAALGDVDGDDDLDIALGNQKNQDLIYYNDGDGLTFSITDTTCYDGATLDLDFGDVNNDGYLDLVVVGHSPDCVCINDGTGHFPAPPRCFADRFDYGTWRVALGDANGDGCLDIAAGEDTDYPIELYLNNGHGYFTETLPLPIGPAWHNTHGLAWGDVDKDGDLDLATGNLNWKDVVYFNEPVTATDSITFTRPIFLGPESSGTNSVAFEDVDGDGDLDLAVGSDGGQNIVYLNTLAWCVSGHVHNSSGNPIPDVTVSAGPDHSATTDASGTYTVTGLMTGTYTLTPSKHGWTFTPITRTVSVPPCATGQDFVGAPYLYLPMIFKNYQP